VKLEKHKPSLAKAVARSVLLLRAYTKTTPTASPASRAQIVLAAGAPAAVAQAQVIALIVFRADTPTQHLPHGHVPTVTSDSTKAVRMKRHASYAVVGNTKTSQHRPTAHPVKLAPSLLS
jgi:hypothetical protein